MMPSTKERSFVVECMDCQWMGNDHQDANNHALTSRHNVLVKSIVKEVYPGQDLCESCKGVIPCDACQGRGHTHQP